MTVSAGGFCGRPESCMQGNKLLGMIFVRRIHGGEHSVHVLGGLVAFQRPLRSGGTLQSWLRCAELAPRTQVSEQESFAS